MSTLAQYLIGESDDMLRSVAGHGVQTGVKNSMRARATDILAPALGVDSLDEVGGIEINAYTEDDQGFVTCGPNTPNIAGWGVYAYPIDGATLHVKDFESKEEAYKFALWLRQAIGEPWVQISSMDPTLVKDEDVA